MLRRRLLLALTTLAILALPVTTVVLGLKTAEATTPSNNLTAMMVWYTTHDDSYLFWTDIYATIQDKDDTWNIHSDQGNWNGVSQTDVSYGYFQYQNLSNTPLGTDIALLNLLPMTGDGLPHSGHYARLDAVHPTDTLKAKVARYFDGQWYTNIRCLITLSVLQAYQAGHLTIGDYVWVYYSTDPRPGHEAHSIPIVVDKVVYP